MPTPCVIRFTDDDGEGQAHVFRKRHGYPEEVITNLSALQLTIERQGKTTSGNVAAQFVFLDVLWYALREIPLGDLEEELRTILYSPPRREQVPEGTYHRQHAILDSTTPIEGVSFLYEVEMDESNWPVRIGHNSESYSGVVEEVFQLVSWDFSGVLAEAIERFH